MRKAVLSVYSNHVHTYEAIIELYLCLSFNVTDPIPPWSHAASKIPILSLYHYTMHLVCKSMQIANYRRLQGVCKSVSMQGRLGPPTAMNILVLHTPVYIQDVEYEYHYSANSY